jgi:hypothetical protein
MKPSGDPDEYLDLCKLYVLAESPENTKTKDIMLAAIAVYHRMP